MLTTNNTHLSSLMTNNCLGDFISNENANFKNINNLNKEIKSKNDRIISMMALCFDLNYDYSKERVYREDYIGKMYKHLKNKKLFKPYVDEVKNYLKGEIKDVR